MALEQEILRVMRYLLRSGYGNKWGGIFPWMVWVRLDTDKSEKTIQRRMLKLAEAGNLRRLGVRSGYVLAA